MPFAVAAQRRDHRHDVVIEQRLQEGGIDALDPAGELVIDAVQDAGRVGDQRVAIGAAQIVGGQALEDLVGDAIGGVQGELQRGGIGDAGAVDVGRRQPGLLRQPANLRPAPCTSTTPMRRLRKQRDVEEDVAEVVVLDDGPVQGDDEDLVPEARDVAEDFAEVGEAQHGVSIARSMTRFPATSRRKVTRTASGASR